LHDIKLTILLLCGAGELQRQLVAEQEARRAVRKDLVAAQREMEELVQHNSDLKRANANMGEEACRVRVEQEELRASFEAQSAELTSLKVSTSFYEHALQTSCLASFP